MDRQRTASSSYRHGPQYARLNSQAGAGGWVSADDYGYYGYQWRQIDLENPHTIVTRVATQGRTTWNHWVTAYKVQYSNDGQNFNYYKEQGQDTVKVKLTKRERPPVWLYFKRQVVIAHFIRFKKKLFLIFFLNTPLKAPSTPHPNHITQKYNLIEAFFGSVEKLSYTRVSRKP